MIKTLSIFNNPRRHISQTIYGAMMAALLFAPNIFAAVHAQNIVLKTESALESDKSVALLSDSVTFREISISDDGYSEIITTYEESYIYQDNVTRFIPDQGIGVMPYAMPPEPALATYGSFRVVTPKRAQMIGTTDSFSLDRFNQMMRAYPAIAQIDMVDVAGTIDDEVNLSLARKIKTLGIATHIPQNGSVRSGGVELFLAGEKRSAHPTANFAVHSWRDEDGMEPHDFADNHPVHTSYIEYYRDIAGMDETQAKAFYWMTNSAPHDQYIDLSVGDIAKYVSFD